MERVKDGARQITAGGSAGFVEICLMHPLDLVKTRFQIQRGVDDPNRYKSLFDCFARIYKTEGFFSFYKGILPPILAETPKRATKFFTFEQYKRLFTHESLPPGVTFSLAGLFCGFTEAFVCNPFEAVKVKLQAQRNVPIHLVNAKELYAAGGIGLNGINKGLTATLMRHGTWNMFYFAIYHTAKHIKPPPQDPTLNLSYRFLLGFVGGTLASIANIPFDVAKSRIQGPQPEPGVVKYKGVFQSVHLVYKEEGFFALYKGLLPKVMRLGPGGAVMLIVYEAVYDFLKEHF